MIIVNLRVPDFTHTVQNEVKAPNRSNPYSLQCLSFLIRNIKRAKLH